MATGATYLERYLSGEYQQVWADLLAQGAQVHEEPLYSDAWAVACETMRRVRANIERMIPRLVQIEFRFGYERVLREILHEPMGTDDWRGYLEVLEWSRAQPPVFMPARLADEYHDSIVSLGLDELGPEMSDPGVAAPDMRTNIEELDRLVGPLPLALRAWYSEVGAVNFYGYHPNWTRFTSLPERFTVPKVVLGDRYLMTECDPLQVRVLDAERMASLRNQYERGLLRQFDFAADRYFKDGTGGSSTPFTFSIPSPGMDAPLVGSTPRLTFVEYLRLCIRWAGFPGMAEWKSTPDNDLARVTKDLLLF
jgi:hypothetical protein